MITAIGTAKSTPIIPIINAHIIILMNITTGFAPKVFCMRSGINTLFSSHWITIIIARTISAPGKPKCTKATITAIDHHKSGPKYGTISVNAPINANDNI